MKQNRNAILPIYDYRPVTEIQTVKPETKIGRIIDMCSGDGAKASDLLPLFVTESGRPWKKDSIRNRFRWELPHKGYGIRTIPDPAGIDHTYVIYAGSQDITPRHLNTILYGPPGTGKTLSFLSIDMFRSGR